MVKRDRGGGAEIGRKRRIRGPRIGIVAGKTDFGNMQHGWLIAIAGRQGPDPDIINARLGSGELDARIEALARRVIIAVPASVWRVDDQRRVAIPRCADVPRITARAVLRL